MGWTEHTWKKSLTNSTYQFLFLQEQPGFEDKYVRLRMKTTLLNWGSLQTDLHETVIQPHSLLGIFKGLSKATEHHEGGCPVAVITCISGASIFRQKKKQTNWDVGRNYTESYQQNRCAIVNVQLFIGKTAAMDYQWNYQWKFNLSDLFCWLGDVQQVNFPQQKNEQTGLWVLCKTIKPEKKTK